MPSLSHNSRFSRRPAGKRTSLFLLIFCLTGCLMAPVLGGHEIPVGTYSPAAGSPVLIGALANRGRDECLRRWQPTATYLERHLPGTRFQVVPLGFGQVADRVAAERVQFIITNPAQYSLLEFGGKAHRIAGFLVPSPSGPQGVFGGVIFTRADRRDIRTLSDLKGKRFSAVDAESLGGWLCASRELHDARLDPARDLAELRFAGTHDAVVRNVLSGTSDAGTIRSSQLETMASQGKVDLRSIRVIPPARPARGYPFLLSTRLYPEWPFAVVTGTDGELSRRVAITLMTMEPDDPAARASGGSGWTVPADYSTVHELLRELHLGPYRDLGVISPAQIIARYWPHLLTAAVAVILVILSATRAWLLNRRLGSSLAELKRARAAADAASHAKSIFLANMNHELRTPLNAILGFAQIMTREGNLSPENERNLAIVSRSSEHLLAMVNEALDLSRIEAGRIELREVTFNLPHCLGEIVDMIRLDALRKGVQLEAELAPGIQQYVRADQGKLRQVLINLLGNAVKFTDGVVTLRARTAPLEDAPSRHCLELEVEDQGPGIPVEKLGLIFEPFTQLDTATNGQQGTGLGLTISRSLIALMGGEIGVESKEGTGALFRVRLPVRVPSEPDEPCASQPRPEELAPLPAEIIRRIRVAARELNRQEILAVAEEMEERHPAVGAFLREQASLYRFEVIEQLLEQLKGEDET